jgi:serine/threonine protein kinase
MINSAMLGVTINNYVIEKKLGDGGMGEVYYAKHNKVDREVAIKILHYHLFLNESIHNRFKNEANALIKLNHPNIVKIYDYVEQDNLACLIMEYINGYTLDEYIEKVTGPLPSARASSIISFVLDAVQYAHDNNVYHRDIKPANIMISKDGNKVRIMDFGIAKLTDSSNFKTTHANAQLGTPFYMSPEQIKGLPYSRVSDIYSIGVTLFEMVTGKCPYLEITNLFELQSKIVNEPLPPTTKYYPDVSPRIQNAIIIATKKKPEERFQNCHDFKKFITENQQIPVTLASQKPQGFVHENKSNKWSMYSLAAGAIVLAVVIISFIIRGSSNDKIIGKAFKASSVKHEPAKNNKTSIIKNVSSISKISISDSNLVLLNKYIETKQITTNKKFPEAYLQKVLNLADSTHILSSPELGKICDKYFMTPVKFPNKQTIEENFWEEIQKLRKGTLLCKIPFDDVSQIPRDKIIIPTIFNNPYDAPKELKITIPFTLFDPDKIESDGCKIILTYNRSGNEYIIQ